MPRLAQHSRDQAIGMLQAGESVRGVARGFWLQKSGHLWFAKTFSGYGANSGSAKKWSSSSNNAESGSPDPSDRFRSAAATAAETPGRANNRISAKTVIRRLREHGLRARRPYVGMVINDRRGRLRRNWANNYRRGVWRNQDWRRVIFSDKSRFKLYRAYGRQRVYRRIGERFAPCNVNPVDHFDGGSVMVWGAIRFCWRSQLLVVDGNLTANRYLDTVLSNQIIPYVQLHNDSIFMHDNARPHVAQVCQGCLRAHDVQVLDWPLYSPDVNPIEHLWDHLDWKVRLRNPPPRNLAQLRQALIEEWHRYPQFCINRLIMPMSRRVWDLRLANGSYIRY